MENRKAIEILKTFSPKELKEFRNFVASPYFNNNPKVLILLNLLKKDYPDFNNKKLVKKKFFKQIFSQKKYEDKKFRYLFTELTKLLEKFLIEQKFSNERALQNNWLLNNLEERGLDNYFQTTLSYSQNQQQQRETRNANYFYEQHLLENSYNVFLGKRQNRSESIDLRTVVENLDLFYIASKLKYCCEIINRKNVIAMDYNPLLLDEILSYLQNNPKDEIPAIAIYHCVLLTLTDGTDEKHYLKLKKLLTKHIYHFLKDEMMEMHTFVLNYCIKQVNSGKPKYLEELFNWYKILLEKKLIFDKKTISQFHYKNIVTVGLRLKKFDWTEKFIHRHKNCISKEFQRNAFTYNLAALYFAKRNYKRTKKLLLEVKFTDVYYRTDASVMLLKTYYELNDTNGLNSLGNTFRMYVKRNKKISNYQRTIYSNLLRFIKQLLKIKNGRKHLISQVKQEIEKTKQVADLKWLNEKIGEFK